MAAKLRARIGGKLRIEPTGLLPVDPETGVHFAGFTDNWWIGLAMLHTLFTLEHNYICDLLAHEHPDWNDEQLFRKAKLINSALMAKIHTVEWTPAILPHPVIKLAMNVNWSGLVGEDLQELVAFLNDNELLGGIVGSHADHHTAPYSLTEEFVGGVSHAPADAGRLRVPLGGDRARCSRSGRSPRSPATGRRRSPSA